MNKFCVLPWIHLATLPSGNVTLCCNSDHTGLINAAKNDEFLNLNVDSIESIINSETFKKVRLQFLNDEIPEACKRCFKEELQGVQSKRLLENSRFDFTIEDARKVTTEVGYIKPNLKFLELRLGNLCNLKCITCNPCSSSSWKTDYKLLEKAAPFVTKYEMSKNNFGWAESEKFWNELEILSDNITQIYINGGEPTLIKKHWSYMEHLLSLGKKDVNFLYSTNVTNVSEYGLNIWKQFDNINIACSVDDVGKRNDYIRAGSDWAVVNENLDKLIESGLNVSICQTISFINYFYLDKFLEWAHSKNLQNSLYYNFVYDPPFLSPMAIPLIIRKEIQEKFKNLSTYNKLYPMFDNTEDSDLYNNAIQYITQLDIIRDESFSKTFPEFNKELINLKKQGK